MNKDSSNAKPTTTNNNAPSTALKLFEPFSLIVFISFYSPIFVIGSLLLLSFMFQNFKGFIYLGFILASLFSREFIYYICGSKPAYDDGSICSAVQYSMYGNSGFSAFVLSFTMTYLFIPMFTNGSPNFWIFSAFLLIFFLDIGVKLYKQCIKNMGDLLLNILLGFSIAAGIVVSMYAGGSGNYLFFNEISSNKDVCSMPSQQTFKCNVFKNGELIGSV
jgi:hypothetical protein